MLGIIKKDLLLMKKYAILFEIITLVYIAAYMFVKIVVFESLINETQFSLNFFSLLPLILINEFNCKNFENEHKSHMAERFFNSLPVSRIQMVLAKYLSSVIFTIIGFINSFLCSILFCYIDSTSFTFSNIKYLIIGFLFIVIFLGLQLPVLIYNGNIMLSFFFPITIFSLPIILITAIENISINELIKKLMVFIQSHKFILDNVVSLTLCLTLLITFSSIYISTLIYSRREFS